jgi:hypothetical protein
MCVEVRSDEDRAVSAFEAADPITIDIDGGGQGLCGNAGKRGEDRGKREPGSHARRSIL